MKRLISFLTALSSLAFAAPAPGGFDGDTAYGYLKQLTDIGPRPSGSPGMEAQQKLLQAHFAGLGAQVEWQRFTAPDPRDASRQVPMANLIVHWNPEATDRIVLAGHYDTLPLPLQDKTNPQGVFVGANDNGSGVAILMELGRLIAGQHFKYGVDFVFFDGEEYVFQDGQPMFLGALEFANAYAQKPPPYRYRWGILLDMVGKKDLHIGEEVYGLSWEDSRPLVQTVWSLAAGLGVKEFAPTVGLQVQDDHVPMHDIAKIPTIDLIDMDYPAWHTTADTIDQCSAETLGKVGLVLSAWVANPELPTAQ